MSEEAQAVPAAPNKHSEKLEKYGISQEQINKWKEQFGRIELSVIGGRAFVYRFAPNMEWQQLKTQTENLDRRELVEEALVKRFVLFPQSFKTELPTLPAGVVPTLAEAITRISGFGYDEEPLEL